jgi:hypothetical protein
MTRTANENAAIQYANDELMRRFGTATFRNGGARSFLWFDLHNAELDRLNALDTVKHRDETS